MAKLYTGELSHRAANSALQIHGGYGFMEESAISRLYRDQKILEIGEGTNEVQRMVIARAPRPLTRRAGTNTTTSRRSTAAAMIARSRQAVLPLENFGKTMPSAAASARTACVVDSVSAVGRLARLELREHALLLRRRLPAVVEAEAGRHRDEQPVRVGERELAAEELRVVLRVAPEADGGAEVAGERDHGDADRVAALVRRGDGLGQLVGGRLRDRSLEGQEDLLGDEDVAGGVAVRLRRGHGEEADGQHGEQRGSSHRPSSARCDSSSSESSRSRK